MDEWQKIKISTCQLWESSMHDSISNSSWKCSDPSFFPCCAYRSYFLLLQIDLAKMWCLLNVNVWTVQIRESETLTQSGQAYPPWLVHDETIRSSSQILPSDLEGRALLVFTTSPRKRFNFVLLSLAHLSSIATHPRHELQHKQYGTGPSPECPDPCWTIAQVGADRQYKWELDEV